MPSPLCQPPILNYRPSRLSANLELIREQKEITNGDYEGRVTKH
ncbi:hypothetical protein [Sivoneniella epilithica]